MGRCAFLSSISKRKQDTWDEEKRKTTERIIMRMLAYLFCCQIYSIIDKQCYSIIKFISLSLFIRACKPKHIADKWSYGFKKCDSSSETWFLVRIRHKLSISISIKYQLKHCSNFEWETYLRLLFCCWSQKPIEQRGKVDPVYPGYDRDPWDTEETVGIQRIQRIQRIW